MESQVKSTRGREIFDGFMYMFMIMLILIIQYGFGGITTKYSIKNVLFL